MTGQLLHLRGDPHDQTQHLLPWYVTGQVDAADRLLIEAHLGACEECREGLAHEQRLSAVIRDMPATSDQSWDRLAARLTQRHETRAWWRRPVRVAWFVAAQAAVVLLCVGLFVSHRPIGSTVATEPSYHALGNAPAARVGNVLVMFEPTASEGMIRGAIEGAGARLVDGPTATGAYLLAVEPSGREVALAALRKRHDVTLAQAVDAPTP